MSTRLLCVGDIHLGRAIRLPNQETVPASQLRVAEAWRRAVQAAIDHRAAAVLLAGDVVDAQNRFFESAGPLDAGVRRLAAAGIPVFAVAGNHDYLVLDELSRSVTGCTLLGGRGAWELVRIPGTELVVAGWSYPHERFPGDPMAGFPVDAARAEAAAGRTVIGLLHCSLGGGDHAPVPSSALQDPAVSAWLLGHIHKPQALNAMTRPVGYLGSICGLDATETGVRGPWLLTVEDAEIRMEHLDLAPWRWERADLDMSSVSSADGVRSFVFDRIRERQDVLAPASGCLVAWRLELTGRCRFWREALKLAESDDLRAIQFQAHGAHGCIDRVTCRVEPELDLEQLAARADALGGVAKRLQALQAGGAEAERLVRAAQDRFAQKEAGNPWAAAGLEDARPEQTRALLTLAAEELLGRLIAQQPELNRQLEAEA